jgi:putative hydrolase of the HAD superfamily
VRGKRALIEEIRAAYNERLVDLLEMFEGVPQALSALRERCRLVIVTNGPVELQEAKLAKFGLREMVDRVVISEAIGMRKPEPAIFHHACSLVNVTPDEAIHVGDSPELDVKGASEAGLTAVWRRPEYPRHWPDGSPRPDAEISHVRELLEM